MTNIDETYKAYLAGMVFVPRMERNPCQHKS